MQKIISEKKLRSLITKSIIKEYYRGFEQNVLNHPFLKVFNLPDLDTALEILIKIPQFQDLLGDEIRTVSDVYNDPNGLPTVEYVLDMLEDELKQSGELEDLAADGEADPEKMAQVVAATADDVEPNDIRKDASQADGESDEIKLTKLDTGSLKGALLQLRNKGIGPDQIRKSVKDAIEALIKGSSMAPFIAKKIADQDAPILLKIGDEIAKILDGDLSNLRERRRK